MLSWLYEINFSKYNSPNIFGLFKLPHQEHKLNISEETNNIVVSQMFKYWIKKSNSSIFTMKEMDQMWKSFQEQIQNCDYFNRDLDTEKKMNEFAEFYNHGNYVNYINFLNKFEEDLLIEYSFKNLKPYYWELLISQLIMRNLGRPFFINSFYYGCNEIDHMMDKSYDTYYDNILFSQNLSLASHLKFKTNTIDKFKIKLSWPWCKNSIINSNFHRKISYEDLVSVNLKDILKYSQNNINSHLLKNSHYFKSFIQLYEYVIPFFPIDYTYIDINLDSGEGHQNCENNEFKTKISSRYNYLNNDSKISKSYIKYCLEFKKYLKYAPENIYKDDFYLTIPYWEIPRIQFINLDLYILYEDKKDWNERMDESEFEKNSNDYTSIINDEKIVDDINKELYIQSLRDQADWDPNWRDINEDPFNNDFLN
jgi:hypothetical protein